ncbi:hypothetical protein [Capnocytophaga cynodegmi]|uniref:hypothetical protein n=1 Tax=Capnocytophaga cynodegmi TaxID=28189 RepID=UPI00385D3BB3
MGNTKNIKKTDLIQTALLIEKIHYIVHRTENREDTDNSAYALAIAFAKQNIQNELNEMRMKLWDYFSEAEMQSLEPELDKIDYQLPYDKNIEELREMLKPYLPNYNTKEKYENSLGNNI